MTSLVSASDKLTRLTSFSIASRMFMIARLFGLAVRDEGLGVVLFGLQGFLHFLRFLPGVVLAHPHAIPDLSFGIRLGHIGLVTFIFESINPSLRRLFVGKSVDLNRPSLAAFLAFSRLDGRSRLRRGRGFFGLRLAFLGLRLGGLFRRLRRFRLLFRRRLGPRGLGQSIIKGHLLFGRSPLTARPP